MALADITQPSDLQGLSSAQLYELADEIRRFVVDAVSETGGHLGSNLGAVELTLALHRVFESPKDAILWDTGHQAYIHKIVTGRQAGFTRLRQAGGISGYPSREESKHDFIENSHASTVLSYAYGLAVARDSGQRKDLRNIVAVIVAIVTVGYMLPWAIAAVRGNRNAWSVFWVNLLLGWTVIGWIIALVMSIE